MRYALWSHVAEVQGSQVGIAADRVQFRGPYQRRSPADYLRRRFLKLLLGDCVLVEPLRLSCCASRRSSPNFASSPAGPPANLSVIPRLPGLRSVDMAMIQGRGPWNRTSQAPLYATAVSCRAEMNDSSGARRQRRHGTSQGGFLRHHDQLASAHSGPPSPMDLCSTLHVVNEPRNVGQTPRRAGAGDRLRCQCCRPRLLNEDLQ